MNKQPNHYLTKKLEDKSKIDKIPFFEANPNLLEPIGPKVANKDGSFTYKKEGSNLSLDVKFKDLKEDIELSESVKFSKDSYVEIVEFQLSKDEKQIYKLPEGYNVKVIQRVDHKKRPNSGSALYPFVDLVVMEVDIVSPTGIIVFSHELAHFEKKDEFKQAVEYYEALSAGKIKDDKTLQLILKVERDAWATSLKKIRPLIKDIAGDEMIMNEIVHNICLAQYSDDIKKNMPNIKLFNE